MLLKNRKMPHLFELWNNLLCNLPVPIVRTYIQLFNFQRIRDIVIFCLENLNTGNVKFANVFQEVQNA